MSKENYKNGKQHGLWECYHENGQLRSKGNYKDGERDGLMEEYAENGQLVEFIVNPYTKSKTLKLEDLIRRKDNLFYVKYARVPFTGVVEDFHDNGELWTKGNFRNGKKHGLWETTYYENGQLRFKENYKNGKLDGLVEEYDENGNPIIKLR